MPKRRSWNASQDHAPAAPASAAQATAREDLLDNGSDLLFRQFLHDAFSIGAQLQMVREVFGSIIGLSGPQYQMLIVVAQLQDTGQEVTVNALAHRLHVTGPFVTAETNKLKKMGRLTKTQGAADRRSVLLAITDAGRADLQRLAPILRAVNNEIFRDLSRADYERLRPIFSKLVVALEDARLLAETLRRKAITEAAA